MNGCEENNYLTFSLITFMVFYGFSLNIYLEMFLHIFSYILPFFTINWIIFCFSLFSVFLPSTLCELKGLSEICDVRREDVLAGVQLIVHQSGQSWRLKLTLQQTDDNCRHTAPDLRNNILAMSDALGMEISAQFSYPAHHLCCKGMDFIFGSMIPIRRCWGCLWVNVVLS